MLEIEKNIKNIEFDRDFRKIKSNLRLLETAGSGRPRISVEFPDDMGQMRELRKNSKDIGKFIEGYKVKLETYTQRLELLNREKTTIRKQLFPAS